MKKRRQCPNCKETAGFKTIVKKGDTKTVQCRNPKCKYVIDVPMFVPYSYFIEDGKPISTQLIKKNLP